MSGFSHMDEKGRPRMVDVTGKGDSAREAVAEGKIVLSERVLDEVSRGLLPKGNLFDVAKLAGIGGAKKTWDLIPLCHPIPLTGVEIDFELDRDLPGVIVRATVRAFSRTGVEMEAMTAVSVAALAIYDMVKGVEKGAIIRDIMLLKKSGGKSGDFAREE